MSKYGKAAVLAVKKVQGGLEPKSAWVKATQEVFPGSPESQKKGCPRCAFLGLAGEGLILGICGGCYTKSEDNKEYALKAVCLLSKCPELSTNPEKMWARIMGGQKKTHNQQMDVVAALWNEGYIVTKTGV